MARFNLPKAKTKPKDYSVFPWTENFRCQNPGSRMMQALEQSQVAPTKVASWLHFTAEVDRAKAELIKELISNKVNIVRNDQEVNLVINLPFCIWRCFDCTRVMYDKDKNRDIYPYYFDALIKEVEQARQIIREKCYIVQNICFTGNIMALEPTRMEELLKSACYSFSDISVELGAPIFVSEEKLAILKKYNVSRIVVNAITFNTVSLRRLCRRFEFKDFYDAYKKIITFGFETCLDLAVGILDEKELRIKRNLELACELGVANINLYSRHCKYCEQPPLTKPEDIARQRRLLDFANKFMLAKGYKPYFLYCTEVEQGCFENVGWTLPGKAFRFARDNAEQISTTLGCGTLSQSLIVQNIKKKRKSMTNPYDISIYIFGINELLEKKQKFFS